MSLRLDFVASSMFPPHSAAAFVDDKLTVVLKPDRVQAILPSDDGKRIELYFTGDVDKEFVIDGKIDDIRKIAQSLPDFIVAPLHGCKGVALVNPEQVSEFAAEEDHNNLWLDDGGWHIETNLTFEELPEALKAQFVQLHFLDTGLVHYVKATDIPQVPHSLRSFARDYVESADDIYAEIRQRLRGGTPKPLDIKP